MPYIAVGREGSFSSPPLPYMAPQHTHGCQLLYAKSDFFVPSGILLSLRCLCPYIFASGGGVIGSFISVATLLQIGKQIRRNSSLGRVDKELSLG